VKRTLAPCAIALAACGLLLAPAPAHADTGTVYDPDARLGDWLKPEEARYSVWSGEIEFGALQTSGNSNTESAHLRSRVLNDRPLFRNSLRLEATYTDSGDKPPAEQYRATEKTALKLTEDDYLFEALRYDRSVVQGIHYRFTEVGGAGRRLYAQDKDYLLLELGAGARQTRRTDQRAVQREAIAVVQSELNSQWGAGSVFNAYAVVEYGERNTLAIFQAALTLRIQGSLSARFSYEVTANTSVPAGVEKVDRVESATLVYEI